MYRFMALGCALILKQFPINVMKIFVKFVWLGIMHTCCAVFPFYVMNIIKKDSVKNFSMALNDRREHLHALIFFIQKY